MQHEVEIKDPCPFDNCSFVSKIFFTWMVAIFKKGYKKEMELTDLHKYCQADDPEKVSDELERNWNKELKTLNPSIVRALGRSFGFRYILYASICLLTECCCKTFQPLLIGVVVRSFSSLANHPEHPDVLQNAYLAAVAICLTSILETFGRNHYQLLVRRIALNCRTSLTVLVYKKTLRMAKSSFEQTSVGQVLNILANDLNRFDELGHVMIYIIVAPIQSLIVMYILWQYLDVASVGGLVILFLFIPFQGLMGRLFNRFRRKTTQITDKRIKLMGEIISAMKLIKVYCWEQPFADVINGIRRREIHMMKWSALLKGTNSALFFVATRIMLFASFMVYIFLGGALTAETVFVTMSLFNALRLPVTNQFPNAVGLGAESLVACKRIQHILLLDEKPTNNLNKFSSVPGSIKLKEYFGKWSKKTDVCNLKNINVKITPGELIVVIGSVGAGKTCLLHALLNEISTLKGECRLNGKTSYAPQEAWCFTGTIRENITLGEKEKAFDQKKYDQVVKVCSLDRDLKLFPDGDRTFVGEKGYTLSGGQKARVSLARAVYNEADVYLLDDPLSAVDPHVANHIFEECVRKYLTKKTVVLVTHQLQFVQRADRIILLKDGENQATGTFDEIQQYCISEGVDIFQHLETELEEKEINQEPGTSDDGDNTSVKLRKQSHASRRQSQQHRQSMQHNRASTISISPPDLTKDPDAEDELHVHHGDDSDNEYNEEGARGLQAEQRSVGSVKLSVYWKFVRAGATIPFVIVLIFALVIPQVIFHSTDLWLAGWTKDYEGDFAKNASLESEQTNVITYSALILSLFTAAFVRVICIYLLTLRCAIELHRRIFSKLLRAPMTFFESNPVGRILNRFTRDLGQIDQKVPATLDDLIGTLLNVIGILITSAIVSWYLMIPALVLAGLSVPFRRVYLRTARDIQRLDAIARSPVYSHISSTFDGLTALRAFGLEERFENQYYIYVKDATAVRFLVLATGRAYSFCLDSFALVYICAVCFFLMAFPDGIPGGDVGLVLSQVLVLIGLFQGCVRKTADFETQMVSCERVLEYGELPTEASLTNFVVKDQNPLIQRKVDDWPTTGSIKFKNVSVGYGSSDFSINSASDNSSDSDHSSKLVLKNVSFKIKGGEKIGIVGRTGAGKSSLISVLFRLIEPDGEVIIDNIDTQMLGLHELRKKISIIPQDPILFSGTVRRNLDPFHKYRDDELWDCLEAANLSLAVKAMPGGLEGVITEGGSNLSVGQRQLLCLARALLKKNNILVLDEATANVDLETDEIIQKTIKTKFVGCTVLTVAHRLNTIIDMDKVLVLDAGKVVEFGEPYLLLSNPEGVFTSMVKQTGPQFSQMLLNLAKKAYYAKHENNTKC